MGEDLMVAEGDVSEVLDDEPEDGSGETQEAKTDEVVKEETTPEEKTEEDVPEEDAEAEEAKRREEQSFKDRYYALLEKDKPVAKQDDTKEVDPVETELAPLARKLQAQVDSGDISYEQAVDKYQSEFRVRKTEFEAKTLKDEMAQLRQVLAGAPKHAKFNALLDVETDGLPAATSDTDFGKEVRRVLMDDFRIDMDNPASFAGATEEQIKKSVIAAKAVANHNLSRRTTTKPKPKQNGLPAGGTSTPKAPAVKVSSYADASKHLKAQGFTT